MKKAILFDLDGTMWDAAEAVTLSWNKALAKSGTDYHVTVPYIMSLMGKTMEAIALEAFSGVSYERAMALLDACVEEENAYLREHGGELFEGLEETLKRLKGDGWFLGIVSNCQEGYIEAFLDYHHLGSYFSDFENFGRTGQGKGANIRLVRERNGLDPVVYLGDTQGDYDAAKEAGVAFIHAAYGFGTVPAGTPAIRDIRELPEAAEKALDSLGRGRVE